MKKDDLSHPPYTTVYLAVCGWQSVLITWDDGYYSPEQTGMGPYGDSAEAKQLATEEAKSWAESEGIEFRECAVKP